MLADVPGGAVCFDGTIRVTKNWYQTEPHQVLPVIPGMDALKVY